MSGTKRFIKLSASDRSALLEGFREGEKATYRQRCHFILLSDQGYELQQIAKLYEVSRQLVARWFDRYEEQGVAGLHAKKGQGQKPILRVDNAEHISAVKELVAEHPQDLNPVLVALEERFGVSMCKRTLQRFLKRLTTPGSDFAE